VMSGRIGIDESYIKYGFRVDLVTEHQYDRGYGNGCRVR
jgi:hypothetical protein